MSINSPGVRNSFYNFKNSDKNKSSNINFQGANIPADITEDMVRIVGNSCNKCTKSRCLSKDGGCKVLQNIPGMMKLVAQGNFKEAAKLLATQSPLFRFLCKICEKHCESMCKNKKTIEGKPFNTLINKVEQFIAEITGEGWIGKSIEDLKNVPKNGKKVAVIGSGPAGLNAAILLRLRGYKVTIFEASKHKGGIPMTGIPDFRFKKEEYREFIDAIEECDINIKTNCKIGKDRSFEDLHNNFDAVIVSAGSNQPTKMNIADEDKYNQVIQGVDILRMYNTRHDQSETNIITGSIPYIGKENKKYMKIEDEEYIKTMEKNIEKKGNIAKLLTKKAIIPGGGNASMDLARVLKRFFNYDVTVMYRKTKDEMPAHGEQVEAAIEDGVNFMYLRSAKGLSKGEDGKLKLTLNKHDFEIDKDGNRTFKTIGDDAKDNVKNIYDLIAPSIGTTPSRGLVDIIEKALGVEFKVNKNKVVVDPANCEAAPRVYFIGDNCSYDGKVDDVSSLVTEARNAVDHLDSVLKDKLPKSKLNELNKGLVMHPKNALNGSKGANNVNSGV